METKDFIDSQKERKELHFVSVKTILSGSILTNEVILKNIRFIVWLTFLGVVYIGNRYHAEKIARNSNTLQKEVNELRAESITTAARLMNLSRQSKVMETVESRHLDLVESVKPPYRIKN
ncbi:MAG: hypothetical protein LBS03_03525 [Bacteroidales bacterium]|jgi:hypothetical protein|nr:hypothetical protein [Bacteroidales bacterium]